MEVGLRQPPSGTAPGSRLSPRAHRTPLTQLKPGSLGWSWPLPVCCSRALAHAAGPAGWRCQRQRVGALRQPWRIETRYGPPPDAPQRGDAMGARRSHTTRAVAAQATCLLFLSGGGPCNAVKLVSLMVRRCCTPSTGCWRRRGCRRGIHKQRRDRAHDQRAARGILKEASPNMRCHATLCRMNSAFIDRCTEVNLGNAAAAAVQGWGAPSRRPRLGDGAAPKARVNVQPRTARSA